MRRLGAIMIAYGIGLIIGNMGMFPQPSKTMVELVNHKEVVLTEELVNEVYPDKEELVIKKMKVNKQLVSDLYEHGTLTEDDVEYFNVFKLQDTLTGLMILLAFPLLLFSLNVRSWFKVAGKTFLSLVLGLVSVIIPILIGYILFQDTVKEAWKVAGMMTGVYSGGTPNLAAIQRALGVNNLTYIMTHTYDLIIGAVFLLFVMSFGQRLLLKFLPAYKVQGIAESENSNFLDSTDDGNFFDVLQKKHILPLLGALGITLLIVGISVGLGEFVTGEQKTVVIILATTTLGILASLIGKVNRIERTFEFGMYFILVFSVVVASMADLRNFDMSYIHIFYWVAIVYAGSLAIHVALAALFKIDADNVIIVSTALSCSPPFVPVVAGALNNKEIILSGLTVGIIGYAIGNYLGILVAEVLLYFG
ncbi:MAG: DUF819 family protein [Bacteroidetes bacterium]|nr:DUF819 family protein [Bacteroidota bacterium]